jgi:hypothetical protein
MSEYDDRQPHETTPGHTRPTDVGKMREEATREMWQSFKESIRKFFVRGDDSKHRYPPH